MPPNPLAGAHVGEVPPIEVIEIILGGLADLALANRHEFQKSGALRRDFWTRHQNTTSPPVSGLGEDAPPKRFFYQPDWEATSCRRLNCWSPYRSIAERYSGVPAPVDCKDCSTSVAGYLLDANLPGHVYVGLVPGKAVSHAVAGYQEKDSDPIRIIDPSRWYGMPPTRYERVVWRRLPRHSAESPQGA